MASSTATKALARAATVGKLTPSTTSFYLCDIQERFRPLMYNSETIVSTSRYLTSVAKALSIPVIATQQYTKVFGPILSDCFANGQEDLDELVANGLVFEKKKFSMMTDEVSALMESDEMASRDNIVLFGIEAHVCVQQTCLDLIEVQFKNICLLHEQF